MRMLYKCPGPHAIHGGYYDHIIVPESETEASLNDGWFMTTAEAKDADELSKLPKAVDETSPATRDELEAKAKELGINSDKRWGDKRLSDAIDEKLKA